MKMNSILGQSRRTKIFSVLTAVIIIALIFLNFFFYTLSVDNNIFLDITYEGVYTLSEAMEDECKEIFSALRKNGEDKKVKFTFCTDPDYIMNSDDLRATYVMALRLRNAYPDQVEVEEINVRLNPTAVSQYKATSLSKIDPADLIVSYGDRYRIVDATGFWLSGNKGEEYYNGEYRVATLIRSVTAISQPIAYFVTGHGETVYDPENPDSPDSIAMADFADLLLERGMKIKKLDLSAVDKIPDDCALLIINNPRSDFIADPTRLDEISYVSETEKVDRYMVMKQGAVIVATDYRLDWKKDLPNLRAFLYEWGFDIGDSLVKDPENSLTDENNSATKIVARYDTDENSFGHAIYGDFADLSSAPLTIFENAGHISCSYGGSTTMGEPGAGNVTRYYTSFLTTQNTAQLYYKNPISGLYVDKAGEAGRYYDLAAVAVRSEIDDITNEKTYSYMLCVNTPDFLSSGLLGEASYANFDITSAIIDNISRVDEHASMHLGGFSLNSLSMGGKKIITTNMSQLDQSIHSNRYVNDDKSQPLVFIKYNYALTTSAVVAITVMAALIPLAACIIGIVVNIKRKNL